jgi:hypothetical protein
MDSSWCRWLTSCCSHWRYTRLGTSGSLQTVRSTSLFDDVRPGSNGRGRTSHEWDQDAPKPGAEQQLQALQQRELQEQFATVRRLEQTNSELAGQVIAQRVTAALES